MPRRYTDDPTPQVGFTYQEREHSILRSIFFLLNTEQKDFDLFRIFKLGNYHLRRWTRNRKRGWSGSGWVVTGPTCVDGELTRGERIRSSRGQGSSVSALLVQQKKSLRFTGIKIWKITEGYQEPYFGSRSGRGSETGVKGERVRIGNLKPSLYQRRSLQRLVDRVRRRSNERQDLTTTGTGNLVFEVHLSQKGHNR